MADISEVTQTKSDTGLIEPLHGLKETTIRGYRGATVGKLVSRYGKPLISYHLDSEDQAKQDQGNEQTPDDRGVPPFVVVGLGRCGCHVSAELAEMIAANKPGVRAHRKHGDKTWVSQFFARQGNKPELQFEPIMLIGDIDETAFVDVDGLMREGGVPSDMRNDFLKLHFQPLAEGGVGHVPIFAEFIARGMLLLPSLIDRDVPLWSTARGLLCNFSTKRKQIPRLVFYIFSSGGGTGAGSAPEIMRAQSYAKAVTNVDREMFFTGVSILPANISRDQTQLINTGRTLVRYLADLNMNLQSSAAYDGAPACAAGSFIEMPDQSYVQDSLDVDESRMIARPILPWNALALISNDVMATSVRSAMTFDEAESNANQYIAQQVFNLAAAQFPAAEFEKEDDVAPITRKNYQEVRLDPNDLKAGLIGPYAVCFSAAPTEVAADQDTRVVDEMFLRSLSLASQHTVEGSTGSRLIEGISIAPFDKNEYQRIIESLRSHLLSDEQAVLSQESLSELTKIPFFERCPRIIYSLTAPQKTDIPNAYKERLGELIDWTFPNLIQTRSAISWGTTAFFSLSIFVETSVLLVPDVQLAIVNYLRLCWQQRRSDLNGFVEKYKQLRAQDPPITDEMVREWLGDVEDYGVNVPNFENTCSEHNRKWSHYVERHCNDPKRKKELLAYRVEDALITFPEAAAAIRYLNYAYNLTKPKPVIDASMLM
jgi:hypothetical protein